MEALSSPWLYPQREADDEGTEQVEGRTTMADLDRPLQPAAHVWATIVDGEAILLDTRRDEFHGLNEVATQIWEALGNGMTPSEVICLLQERYEVQPLQLRADLLELVDALLEREIVEYRQ
jgi:hypothetical protein